MPSPSLHDISFGMEYVTKASREASFAPPSKRSKSGWPHKTPTAKDLSKAGFYYKPTSVGDDNTECFLCHANLNGWEADDDPVQEHLKHAEGNCGWAVLTSTEAEDQYDTPSMEDPTGSRMAGARKATFAIGWPHESKRGWTCKTDKMVEAGWYFAPSAESEDYVSCVYCKLSLDGWEPKDNPFEEHHSRSPWCPFFVFAGSTAPSKRPKAKKGRTSRASRTSKASTRLSTQSNATIQSEAASIPDLDESIDTSAVSLLSTASTATNKGKRKGGAGRAKSVKAKRTKKTKKEEEPPSQVESQQETPVDGISYPQLQEQPEPQVKQPEPVLDTTSQEPPAEETPRARTPELVTGPPRQPTPTIPASAESPVPASSRRSLSRRRSSGRLMAKEQVATTPPPVKSSPSQPSDVENAPPSTRPKSVRPPLTSPGALVPKWDAVDIDMIFETVAEKATGLKAGAKDMTEAEKQMTVQDWIKHIADQAESDLRAEGERVVGIFEKEGQRALTVLEGIVCA